MTDRELLELAAKAAGIGILRCRLDDPMWRDMLLVERQHGNGLAIGWNPLTDDGDALRLAVTLNLAVTVMSNEFFISRTYATLEQPETTYGYGGPLADDRFKSVRHGIARLAAEIGKAMPDVTPLQQTP